MSSTLLKLFSCNMQRHKPNAFTSDTQHCLVAVIGWSGDGNLRYTNFDVLIATMFITNAEDVVRQEIQVVVIMCFGIDSLLNYNKSISVAIQYVMQFNMFAI